MSVEGAQNAAQFYELSLDLSLPFPTRTDAFRNIVAEFARRAGFGRFFGNDSPLNLFTLPEPSTGLLMAIGVSIFAWRQRRIVV